MIRPKLFPRVLLLAATAALWLTAHRSPALDNQKLLIWLDAQTNVSTWSAEFIQTRTLASLTQPLTATGRVWFAAPNR